VWLDECLFTTFANADFCNASTVCACLSEDLLLQFLIKYCGCTACAGPDAFLSLKAVGSLFCIPVPLGLATMELDTAHISIRNLKFWYLTFDIRYSDFCLRTFFI